MGKIRGGSCSCSCSCNLNGIAALLLSFISLTNLFRSHLHLIVDRPQKSLGVTPVCLRIFANLDIADAALSPPRVADVRGAEDRKVLYYPVK